jgi:hypothetical protein
MLCRVIIPVYFVVFRRVRKGAVDHVTSFFHLSAWDCATVIGRIFVIFHIRDIYQNFLTPYDFSSNRTETTDTLHEPPRAFIFRRFYLSN